MDIRISEKLDELILKAIEAEENQLGTAEILMELRKNVAYIKQMES